DAVISGKNDDRRAIGARLLDVLQAGKLDRQRLKPTERTGRLGKLALACGRRVAMAGRDGGAWLGDPIRKHALPLVRNAFENVAIHDPAVPPARLCPRRCDLRRRLGQGTRKNDLMRHAEISAPPDVQISWVERLERGAAV